GGQGEPQAVAGGEPREGGEHLDVEAGDGAGGHRPRRRAGERVVRQQRPAVGGEPAPRPVEGTEGAEERTARQRRRGAGGGDVLEGRLELDLRAGRGGEDGDIGGAADHRVLGERRGRVGERAGTALDGAVIHGAGVRLVEGAERDRRPARRPLVGL